VTPEPTAAAVADAAATGGAGAWLLALSSGLVGAVLVFLLGWWREWWRNERKPRGLLLLLLAEIKHNEIVIAAIQDSGTPLPTSPYLEHLKTETWAQSREIATDFPPELLRALISYYEPLEIFRTLKSLPPPDPNRPAQSVREAVERSLESLREPLNRLLGIPTDRRETYQQRMLRAQDSVKEHIVAYLGRRSFLASLSLRTRRGVQWWRRMFGG
jgi:hypothetical protein